MIRVIKHLLTPKIIRFFAVLYTITIIYGSLIKTSNIPELYLGLSDKVIHAVAYFFLSCIWFFGVFSKKSNFFKTIFAVAGIIFIFGIIIEVLQEVFSTGRQADFYDVMANCVGILAASVLIISLNKILFRLNFEN